ncbi:MAG: FAD-dependent monooxygenase [Stellaceae bacterium]
MTRVAKVAIVGGGLAGLATVNALSKFGFEAELFEQSATLSEVGAGINTSPQGVKALQAIGLTEQVAKVGNASPGIFSRNMQTGEPLEFFDRTAMTQRFGAPYYSFHRADLLDALASGVAPDRIHLKHRLVEIEEQASCVLLGFANGERYQADIVIAADGIHSAVRQALYGHDDPTYTGQMVWRALLDGRDVSPELVEPTGHIQWLGPGCHLLAYYLRGTEALNIVTQEDTEKWVEEGWSIPGNPDEMRLSFPNPEPRLRSLLSLVAKCSKWGLFTRPLTENWGRGRILLIGDAAHAMLPNIGQGACMAFEDASILARWLDAQRDEPAAAFRNFRRIRIPRVHAVQRTSFAYAKLKHMRDREAQKEQIAKARSGGNNLEWIWGYEPVRDWDKMPFVPPGA